jgi:hypothetical protein
MNREGKYDREDLVRLAVAAFGPLGEVDAMKGEGVYVDLLKNDGPLRVVKVCRLTDGRNNDEVCRKVLKLAGVEHDSWTEAFEGGKKVVRWESVNDVCQRVRAARGRVRAQVEEQLRKQGVKSGQ